MEDSLQNRISRILNKDGKGRPTPDAKSPRGVTVPSLPPGDVVEGARGPFYEVRVPLSRAMEREAKSPLDPGAPPWTIRAGRGAKLHIERPFFFDLETTGFTSTPMFLVSSLLLDGGESVVVQRFARDYSEEEAVVAATVEEIARADALVSYNGKSYDLPFLRNRAAFHKVPFRFDGGHADLLHICRRRWKGRFPDYRLQTMERFVVPLSRADDIPSAEIPALYHRFVRFGFDPRMRSVFRHNLRDVITMVRLFAILSAEERKGRKNG